MQHSFSFDQSPHRITSKCGWLRGEHKRENQLSVKGRQSRQRKATAGERRERVDSVHSHRVYDRQFTRDNNKELRAEIQRLTRATYKLSRKANSDAEIASLRYKIASLQKLIQG